MLREDGLALLASAVGRNIALNVDQSVVQVAYTLRTGRCDVLVIDPSAHRADATEHLVATAETAGVGLLLYTVVDAHSAPLILRIAAMAHTELIAVGADNEISTLRRRIQEFQRPSAAALVLRAIAAPLQPLGAELREFIVGLFAGLPIPNKLTSLRRRKRPSLRTWQRQMRSAGLALLEDFVHAASLARVWDRLVAHDGIAAVVRECGHDEATLRRRFKEIVEVAMGDAQRTMSTEELAGRLGRKLLRARPRQLRRTSQAR